MNGGEKNNLTIAGWVTVPYEIVFHEYALRLLLCVRTNIFSLFIPFLPLLYLVMIWTMIVATMMFLTLPQMTDSRPSCIFWMLV